MCPLRKQEYVRFCYQVICIGSQWLKYCNCTMRMSISVVEVYDLSRPLRTVNGWWLCPEGGANEASAVFDLIWRAESGCLHRIVQWISPGVGFGSSTGSPVWCMGVLRSGCGSATRGDQRNQLAGIMVAVTSDSKSCVILDT